MVIERAQAEFESGRGEFERGRLEAGREHFNRAVEILISQPGGVRANSKLQAAYERMVDRISALEVQVLRDGDGVTES